MDILLRRIERNELEKGDHIFTYRAGGAYAHHGIYVKHDMVVHYINPSSASSSSISRTPSTTCRYVYCTARTPESGVIYTCLDCFLKNGALYRFKYGVNFAMLCLKRGGTCTTAVSDDPTTVVDRASDLLRYGFGPYHLFQNNCEDFTLYCKTGLLIETSQGQETRIGRSGQISSKIGFANVAIFGFHPLLSQIPAPLRVTVGLGMYCSHKIAADIGVRTDAIVRSVGYLAERYGWVIDPNSSPLLDYVAIINVQLASNGRIRRSDV